MEDYNKKKEQNRKRLLELLEQLFQLDQPDLDFGFYKIMHAKADVISSFIETDMLEIIEASFAPRDREDIKRLKTRFEEKEKQAIDSGLNPSEVSSVRFAQEYYEEAKGSLDTEIEVYENLYRFFSRYYEDGDFISLRYYGSENDSQAAPYSVPYDGREVYFHWANRDQYYTKTTEYLRNFSFDIAKNFKENDPIGSVLPKSLKLHFRILGATEGEHNNNKENGNSKRYFIINKQKPFDIIHDSEAVINFEYRSDPNIEGNKNKWQEKKIDEAELLIQKSLENLPKSNPYRTALLSEVVNGKSKKTLLRKYLNKYTARNSRDYFIHKDLGGFLKRELDFFIKNEVIHLDEAEKLNPHRFHFYLKKIKVLRRIGQEIITILAQLENFQKKLWLKKKFVTDTQYCITLDKIPPLFYPEIIKNKNQIDEWEKLFAISEIKQDKKSSKENKAKPKKRAIDAEFLDNNKYLMLDTGLFSADFKDRLIAEISQVEALESEVGGLLVHGDNFHALELMQNRHRGNIDMVYIDPPYNKGSGDFLFKDGYQHSSWLSSMAEILTNAESLLSTNGVSFVSIDDDEICRLYQLISERGEITIWRKTSDMFGGGKMKNTNTVRTDHEYVIVDYKGNKKLNKSFEKPNFINKPRNLDNDPRGDWESASISEPPKDSNSNGDNHYTVISPSGVSHTRKFIFPQSEFNALHKDNRIYWGQKNDAVPREKIFLDEKRKFTTSSIIQNGGSTTDGTKQLTHLLNDEELAKKLRPKPLQLLAEKLLIIGAKNDSTILDYFAGSGTTGHAVLELNREDGGKRKYIMVEMGSYFDSVTKIRMQKAVYSKDWKEGKPISREGISHAFKYIRLESYEDTMNNLVITDNERTKLALVSLQEEDKKEFNKNYLLHYWLDIETKGSPSLLNITNFSDPGNYKMQIKKVDSDEYEKCSIDLVETFNWLLGLQVEHLDKWRTYTAKFKREEDPDSPKDDDTCLILDGPFEESEKGKWSFRKISGKIVPYPEEPTNTEKVLIIWRKLTGNLEEDNLMLDEWFKHNIAKDKEWDYDYIYVNGSNQLQNVINDIGKKSQVLLLEESFHRNMWSEN